MRPIQARVRNFKSIDDSGDVTIDPKVTVIVGQNEAGKTAFLQALEKARPIRTGVGFNVTEDYPRKGLIEYRKRHAENPDPVVTLTYALKPAEVEAVNAAIGARVLTSPQFSLTYRYNGHFDVDIAVDERAFVKAAIAEANLSGEVTRAARAAATVRDLIQVLGAEKLTAEGQAFLADLTTRFGDALKSRWRNVVAHEVWHQHIGPEPKFLYFGDYQLLPGKVNLPTLQQKVANRTPLTDEDQTVLRLLRMAGVEIKDVLVASGYEEAKARLEGLSNAITDRIFEFWTQNREIDVEFDIRPDPADPAPPFNNGPNLYIRIKSRRHRVSVPFNQRSKGFIWFFSFLVWFDSVRVDETDAPIILLLDEPGLSLHALAQADLLRYIDTLSERHQVVYTTHSPFMVRSDHFYQVRVVEDRPAQGTVVTDNVTGSDPKTLFPLQAALGYTIAQNLFISARNLLVEGPADLVYLKFMSAQLEAAGRTGLRDDVTIVPAGGLDKVATFLALLNGNQLEMAVVHDFASRPEPRLEAMVKAKIIRAKQVLHYGTFRNGAGQSDGGVPATDVEDLFTPELYLQLFNGAFANELGGRHIAESDLPPGDRIVERLERYLATATIKVRPSGGFNHYAVANYLALHPLPIDAATLDRFEALFQAVNKLYA